MMPHLIVNTKVCEGHLIVEPAHPEKSAYVAAGATLNPDGAVIVVVSRSTGFEQLNLGKPGELVGVFNRKFATRNPNAGALWNAAQNRRTRKSKPHRI